MENSVGNCISTYYVEKEHVMHSKSKNREFMPYDNSIEIIDVFFQDTTLLRNSNERERFYF